VEISASERVTVGETWSGERVATHLDGVLVQIGQFLYA